MALYCELSGELLASSSDEVVVTPSGHICLKRLLLSRLTENRGVDPFDEDRPLSEDDLVTLQISKPKVVPPRTNQTNSFPGLLNSLQNEYDALVLELFDTRKALEETRRELSQALYQNDAAMRVIARVALERDQARQQLEEWKVDSGHVPGSQNLASQAHVVGDSGESVSTSDGSKKRKLDVQAVSHMINEISKEDLNSMIEVWERLHKSRKALQKEAASVAPSKQDIAGFVLTRKEDWLSTSTSEGVAAMTAAGGSKIAAAAMDKSLVVYDLESRKTAVSLQSRSEATCVDMNENNIVAGCSSGAVQIWKANGELDNVVEAPQSQGAVVAVNIHPDRRHILAASDSGTLSLIRMGDNTDSKMVSVFEPHQGQIYSSGTLHPDGLIYLTGCSSGKILLWDLKSQSMAGVLEEPGNDSDPVVSLDVSNNGYHIAASSITGRVRVWDLRKQKVIAVLNQKENPLESVLTVAFDESGKYLAYGGKGGLRIVTVKEWESTTASLNAELTSGVVWGKDWVATCSTEQRDVVMYGKEAS